MDNFHIESRLSTLRVQSICYIKATMLWIVNMADTDGVNDSRRSKRSDESGKYRVNIVE